MAPRRRSDLPAKVCPVCGRPFHWRHKWARDWDQVRYCSERCRRGARAAAVAGVAAAATDPPAPSGRSAHRRPRP
ncbi:DUF2256 domain-containing protein [Conexibacter sp. DBS9H8]|uniref:DUF2256 domain-containing protein n=1 Tax=Conexibacter sp. DBS9H8 TaxID=2937801 RepID=UPI00200C2DFD|nr:DUF2256 domain-containing protein [Conexibacter sp. DBS9H8]